MPDQPTLVGRSVLITGGGSGIGAGTARYVADAGALVTIAGRRADRVRDVAASIGPACLAVAGDIRLAADREHMLNAALEHGGGLHALVNNAGNMLRGPLETLEQASLTEIFQTNVIAPMLLTSICAEALAASHGAIVFIGSIHNRRAFPGVSPYAATKGAIEALTRSLAAELGPRGIRVNCVAPGAVPTEINQRAGVFTDEEAAERFDRLRGLHALGRIGTVDEVAQAIAYLITASWTTGAVLDVDGGLALGLTNE